VKAGKISIGEAPHEAWMVTGFALNVAPPGFTRKKNAQPGCHVTVTAEGHDGEGNHIKLMNKILAHNQGRAGNRGERRIRTRGNAIKNNSELLESRKKLAEQRNF